MGCNSEKTVAGPLTAFDLRRLGLPLADPGDEAHRTAWTQPCPLQFY